MESLPRERPVTGEAEMNVEGIDVISPEVIRRLQGLLKELNKQRPAWRQYLPPLSPPRQKVVRAKISDLKDVDSLLGAKVLYLDDGSQFYLEFLTYLTLATRRRVERIFYHGESLEELVHLFRERFRRCPQPHLLISDGVLELLPSLEPASHRLFGSDVIAHIRYDLEKAGIPSIGYSTTLSLREDFLRAGAEEFVGKNIPAVAAVEQVAKYFSAGQRRQQRQRREEELFLCSD